MRSGRARQRCGGLAWLLVSSMAPAGLVRAQQPSPLAAERLDTLPEPTRRAWRDYVASSTRMDAMNRAVMARELRAASPARMTRAPFAAEPFTRAESMTPRWLSGDAGQRAVRALLSFQTPAGGWSKHVSMTSQPRHPGQSWFSESDGWEWIGTIDQGSTVSQVRFLLAADSAHRDAAALDGARRGVEYLLAAQMPSGCWPQVFPLIGGYHDAVAVASDATSGVLRLLGDITTSRLPIVLRARAREARAHGLACVISLQHREGDVATGWALFHNPLSGEPVAGRSFEPAALAPLETAGLLDELLSIPVLSAREQAAAHGAAAWLRRVALADMRYEAFTPRPVDSSGVLLWPRLIALAGNGAGAPLFSNRDGQPQRDWAALTDRRTGYQWYGTVPEAVLERYLGWATAHPATGALAVRVPPTDSIAHLPGRSAESDTIPLVSGARLERMRPAPRRAWELHAIRSRAAAAVDREAMARELARYGRTTMRSPAWAHDFSVTEAMTDAWFASDSARRMGESILSFQTPGGGWSKHVDFTAGVRLPGESYNGEIAEWRFIATIDNASTTEELRFLARRERVHPDARYRAAFLRGMRYLLDAQMAVGCWPQVFPLQGGYHDALTFNDDAIVNVAQLLSDVREGLVPFVSPELRSAAGGARDRAIGCMLNAQVVVNGYPTIWAQQHDPVTLLPVAGRSYELAALGPDESAHIAEFLMRQPNQAASLVRGVHAAADWFRGHRIDTLAYSHYVLTRGAGPTPLWGRMVEIETGRPIFANRDGRLLYDYEQLIDRRTGYRWFTAAPAEFLREYERWSTTHPAVDASSTSRTSTNPGQ